MQTIAGLSHSVFWLVLASLPCFPIPPALLNAGWGIWTGMGVASCRAVIAYPGMTYCLFRVVTAG